MWAAEYGEHWEHRSQEISAEKWPFQEISVQLPGNLAKNPGRGKMHSLSRGFQLSQQLIDRRSTGNETTQK